jgi:pyruvate dehydrogenase E2 component (dihydrolipoamide acetyltransferase)
VRAVKERYDEALEAIRCPVTLVWGDDDNVVPITVARSAASRLEGAKLVVCPGAGHLTPLSAPAALRGAVDERLVERGSRRSDES